ncbi:3-oxo-tetronate kinase [Microbacterium sp. P01]|uniref:3-oxo-tetronate kinase n=1 Tax=unclassified Microbacterium TaxID=2609290 RepID=UPI00366BD7F1
MSVHLGVIADDITGACDVAGGVSQTGMPAEVRLGVPDVDDEPATSCVVVALKSRAAIPDAAVAESVASARILRAWGATVIYQKYCSTFDSTDTGNIGPVADALIDDWGSDAASVGTPATPAAHRTLYLGHLFVGDRLLSESSVAQHPLTPMKDPDLIRVLARQTSRPVGGVALEDVRAGASAVRSRIAERREVGVRHLLVDATQESDLDVIADALIGSRDLIVGGAAGLAVAIARTVARAPASPAESPSAGGELILSGSGSERTREQVAAFRGPVMHVDPDEAVATPESVIGAAMAFVAREPRALVSVTAAPEAVAAAQRRWGSARAASALETVLGRVAALAVENLGIRRILVAGGETSGAVAHALGVRRLRVRRVVSTGVPWMSAVDSGGRRLDLCFKSGNFGEKDLFESAWAEGRE